MSEKTTLNFIANARLKDVVGRDLINDDNIAIIELIKNAKDAGSKAVTLRFGNIPSSSTAQSLIIRDSGKGMSEDDIRFKWLNIAFSEKKGKTLSKSESYAGNKGIGRFACDRLGKLLVLYTRVREGNILRLEIDWTKFEVDDKAKEIGKIKTFLEVITLERLKEETGIPNFSNGTVLHVTGLREHWNRDKLIRLRRQLEKFVIDPNKSFKVTLIADEFLDIAELNGVVENKIFEKLSFRTTSIHSEIDDEGNSITTKLIHDGATLFTLKEKNPYGALKNIQLSVFFLNQPAKVIFKAQTGYRSISYGSVFLFLNGFRVMPYGSESDDWLGLDRRKQQGQRRFFGTRDLVGFIELNDKENAFQAVSSREGLVNNRAFHELTSQAQDVPSNISESMEYGYFHKVCRKLEKFVVDGLDWDSISTEAKDESELLDPSKYQYKTDKQRIIECLESIISIRTDSELVEDLEVEFRNLIKVAKDETASYEALVENLQDKFEGTAVSQLTPAEKRDLSKFVQRQSKEIAAKEATAKRLDQKLAVETKRRLFAEFEKSADTDRILKMHHQTRLLASKVFKQLDAFLQKFRVSPDGVSLEDAVALVEKTIFDVDKIRKVSEFASKASFNLATNRVTEDILLFIEEYVERIEELSASFNLKVSFRNPRKSELRLKFRPLELMMLVDNIIDNAGKAKAKKLEIVVTEGKSKLTISFNDDGVGLPPNMRNADLFEKGITTTSGSGIGLYHIRQIATELHGNVKIRDNTGKGTSVVLEFAIE